MTPFIRTGADVCFGSQESWLKSSDGFGVASDMRLVVSSAERND